MKRLFAALLMLFPMAAAQDITPSGNLVGPAILDLPLAGGTMTGALNGPAVNGVQVVGQGTNTSIHAAVANLGSNGGLVSVPCGTYSDNVDITAYGISIVGEGENCVTVTPANATTPVFKIDASSVAALEYVTIENMTIECPLSTACGDGIEIIGNGTNQPNDNHVLKNLNITDASNSASSSYGFLYGLDIEGRTIWSKFENITILNSRGNGLNINSSQPVNGDIWKDSSFSGNWNYGVYINATASPASTNNTFDNTTIQQNGQNAALGNCAGFYETGIGTTALTNDYFENNCAGNTSVTSSKIAHIRLTGTYNQAVSVRQCDFFSPNSEWDIYNDTTQTAGEYDGLSDTSGRGIYLATSHSSSAVHIGTNFEVPIDIVADSNGRTHEMSSYPLGIDITEYNSSTVSTISASLSSDIWLTGSSAIALTVIPGGHAGQVLFLRNAGTSTVTLIHNSGGPGSLFLITGATRTMGVGQTALLLNDGANWQEIAPGPYAAVGSPTVNQAACIKSAGPPVVIGYCSTVVSSSGGCTCN